MGLVIYSSNVVFLASEPNFVALCSWEYHCPCFVFIRLSCSQAEIAQTKTFPDPTKWKPGSTYLRLG